MALVTGPRCGIGRVTVTALAAAMVSVTIALLGEAESAEIAAVAQPQAVAPLIS